MDFDAGSQSLEWDCSNGTALVRTTDELSLVLFLFVSFAHLCRQKRFDYSVSRKLGEHLPAIGCTQCIDNTPKCHRTVSNSVRIIFDFCSPV